MATVVHSVHCMMGIDSMPSAGAEMSVEEQVERLFVVRNYPAWLELHMCYEYIHTTNY